jgi:hypothetical protein
LVPILDNLADSILTKLAVTRDAAWNCRHLLDEVDEALEKDRPGVVGF